ncbi:MAG TPA: serine/threonine protein kinase, partial [Vicinamibacteria bacterium]
MTLASGTTFGVYQILDPLGRGGMATVYKAYEPGLDRYVALKILPREFLHDEGFAERFKREAKVIARLEHPNIIPI